MAVAGTLTYKTEVDQTGIKSGMAKTGSIVKGVIAGLGITKLISTAMNTIRNSTGDAIKRLDTLNNFPKVMSNLGISAEESSSAIKKMSDKLSGLPTTLDQGASAVQRFTSKNNDVKKSTDIFLALNNAILAGGAPTEQQASALEQLSQAYAKGKPDMMEWRSAMTVMPAQLNQVAKAMGYGKNGADKLGEALRKGDVSMDEFMDTVVELNEKGVDGFENFEKQARNSTGGIETAITVAKTQIVKGVTDIIDSLNKNFEKTKFGSLSGFISQVGNQIKKGLDSISKLISGTLSPKEFFDTGFTAIENLLNGITSKIPDITETAGSIINDFVSTLNEHIDKIYSSGVTLITTLINGISEQIPVLLPTVVETIVKLFVAISKDENLNKIADAGAKLVISLIKGILNSIPKLLVNTDFLINAFLNIISGGQFLIKKLGFKLILSLIKGLIESLPDIAEAGFKIIKKLIDKITSKGSELFTKGKEIVTKFINGIKEKGLGYIKDVGKQLIEGLWKGIKEKFDKVIGKIGDLGKQIGDKFKKVFKIKSPSRVFRDEIGKNLMLGIAVGIDTNVDSVDNSLNDMYREINKTIQMENARLNFDVVSGDTYNKAFYQTPVQIGLEANVEMESQKVGRLVTPSVVKTIKTGGGTL